MINVARRQMNLKVSMITLIIASTSALMPAQANEFNDCSASFYGGIYPEFMDNKLSDTSYPLCFDGFAVMYSDITLTPLWSAEHLTRQRLQRAKEIDRNDSFHEESEIPESVRAKVSYYSGSGYDRGHLAPNANMATRSQQHDSFSLANIAPQSPRNNRYVWRNIESATRYLTQQYGQVYTVTGVTFENKIAEPLEGRIIVPSHFFKAVYIPAIDQAGVYYAPNDESESMDIISLDQLTAKIGIDVLPVLDRQTKAQALALPEKAGESIEVSQKPSEEPSWILFLLAIIDWLITQLQA